VKGSTYKRCGCRGEDGKQLGARCPRLRRRDGTWNPRHGAWTFAVSYAGRNGQRTQVVRGGFASEDEAQAELDRVKAKIGRGVDVTGDHPRSRRDSGPAVPPWRTWGEESGRDSRGLKWLVGGSGCDRGQHVGVIRDHRPLPVRALRVVARRPALTRRLAHSAAAPHQADAGTDPPCCAPGRGATATRAPTQAGGRTGSDPIDQPNDP
jgi:Arm DNA-binding domain